ncbi:MAG: beta-glucanase (GH16 family) [Vicingaceae bacterium]|jgi:beta-glucanase (GH16 family)
MLKSTISSLLFFFILTPFSAQIIQDDFEGNGTITSWFGDDCGLVTNFNNPQSNTSNSSNKVLSYHDIGGQYANIRFDVGRNLNLSNFRTFTLKVYVPSLGITGTQNNQISLKLQDGSLAAPWSTQSEIVKPIQLNTWQTVSFDFANDPYINLNANSLPPTQRTDFNRILIQLNGENNNDQVLAYIDDFYYFDSIIPPPVYNNLVWSDEFSTNGPVDATKWFHQTQLPQGGNWYNGEIQHYTNRTANSVVSNGELNLIAKRESFTDQGHTKQFTSARLNSKFAFTYGKVEVRAKMPTGVGTWPAIWMLGKNITEPGGYWQTQNFATTPWPACGEIDIMEHWGNNQNYVSSATHTTSSSGNTINTGGRMIPTVSTAYHVYTLEWRPDRLIFSVDSIVHFTYQPAVRNNSTWPFDADQYILLNIAIEPTIASSFTQSSMDIDYIRIYQETPVGIKENKTTQNLSLYPNPVNNELTIQLNSNSQQTITVQIYSIEGKLMKTSNSIVQRNQIKINQLDDLTNGLYFISFELEGQLQHTRFIKR